MSKKDIAKAINVDLSTIYRELKRNNGSRNHYNWETAEANARRKKRRTPGKRSQDSVHPQRFLHTSRRVDTWKIFPDQLSAGIWNTPWLPDDFPQRA